MARLKWYNETMDKKLRQLKRQASSGNINDIADYYASLIRLNQVPPSYWVALSATDSPIAQVLGIPNPLPVAAHLRASDVVAFVGATLGQNSSVKDYYDYNLLSVQLLLDTWNRRGTPASNHRPYPNPPGPYDLRREHGVIQPALDYLKTLDPSAIPPRAKLTHIGVGPYLPEPPGTVITDISGSHPEMPELVTRLLDTVRIHYSRDPERHTNCYGMVEYYILIILMKFWYEISGDLAGIAHAIEGAEGVTEVFWDVSHMFGPEGEELSDDEMGPEAGVPIEFSIRNGPTAFRDCGYVFESLALKWQPDFLIDIQSVVRGIHEVSHRSLFDTSDAGRLKQSLERRELLSYTQTAIERFLIQKINAFGV